MIKLICTCDDLVNNGDHYCPIHGTFPAAPPTGEGPKCTKGDPDFGHALCPVHGEKCPPTGEGQRELVYRFGQYVPQGEIKCNWPFSPASACQDKSECLKANRCLKNLPDTISPGHEPSEAGVNLSPASVAGTTVEEVARLVVDALESRLIFISGAHKDNVLGEIKSKIEAILRPFIPSQPPADLFRSALRKLIADKEPNKYPLWFNRAVRACKVCDSEDLCNFHYEIAERDFAGCEEMIVAFENTLLAAPVTPVSQPSRDAEFFTRVFLACEEGAQQQAIQELETEQPGFIRKLINKLEACAPVSGNGPEPPNRARDCAREIAMGFSGKGDNTESVESLEAWIYSVMYTYEITGAQPTPKGTEAK